jgi:hypothetical protein
MKSTQFLPIAQRAFHRIYADFCLPSRITEYRDLLQYAIDQGYETHSLSSFWGLIRANKTEENGRYLLIRHDVDTAATSARAIWETEQRLKATSTYYFRLKTMEFSLLKEMHLSGFEASYHYEELSTVVKKQGIREPEHVKGVLPHIRELFKGNLERLRVATGLPMRTVAAHGDFINWRIKIPNTIILEDKAFRNEVGVDLEAYDDVLMRHVIGRYADVTREYPRLWRTQHPTKGFDHGESVIYLLIHPEAWVVDARQNFADDVNRLMEEITCFIAARKHGSAG